MIGWIIVIIGLLAYALHWAEAGRTRRQKLKRGADSLDLSFLQVKLSQREFIEYAHLLQVEVRHQQKVDAIEQLWHDKKPLLLSSKTDSVLLHPKSKEYAAFVAGLKHATRELQKLPIDYPETMEKQQ